MPPSKITLAFVGPFAVILMTLGCDTKNSITSSGFFDDASKSMSPIISLLRRKLPALLKHYSPERLFSAPAKTEFLDFLDPKFGLAGPTMPEKIEGLAWGKDLEDGRHVLIVTTDNDLNPDQPSWFWAFAVDRAEVVGLALP